MREVLELLELGRLFFRQVRVERVAPELAAEPERVASARSSVSVSPIVIVVCFAPVERVVRAAEGKPLHDRAGPPT